MINYKTPDAFVGDWIIFQEQMLTSNVGAEIRFAIEGADDFLIDWPNCNASKDDQQTIAIKIDNQEFQNIFLENKIIKYQLPDSSLHQIRIVVSSNVADADYWFSDQDFRLNRIFIEKGELIVTENNSENLYFIGDSITSGSKILTSNSYSKNNHAESSYPIQFADYFDLNNIRISYNGTGITSKATIYPPSAFDFIWKLKNDLRRPSVQQAKAVIINLGTNDSKATPEEFSWSLNAFLIEIVKRFHQAPIYLMIPLNQQFAGVFRKIAISFSNVNLIETADIKVTFADRLHPDQNGHDMIAKYLIEYFSREFNNEFTN